MSKRPFLAVGLFSFAAALCCARVSSLSGIVVVVAVSLVALIAAIILHRLDKTKAAIWATGGALLMSALFLVKELAVVYPQLAYADRTVLVTVRVEEQVSSTTYLGRVEGGDLKAGMRLRLVIGNENIAPKPGDLLQGGVELSAMFDNASFESVAYAKVNDTYLNAWSLSNGTLVWKDGSDTLSAADRALYASREYIHNTLYRRMSFDNAALSEATVLGQRHNVSGDIEWAFRASGIYHLLAVSGMHLTILTGVALRLLRTLGLKRRICGLAAMGVTVAFVALCGFAASIVRAGVMVLIALSGMLFRRRADALNSLGFAAFVMLLFDPFTVYDLGFQLSFAAALGLILLFPVWEREVTQRAARRVGKAAVIVKPLLSMIGVPICATLMTQPLSALYFGELSIWFLVGNLLCVWASEWLLIVMFLCFIAAGIPFVGEALFWVASLLCRWQIEIADVIASWPLSSIAVRDPALQIWVCALTVVVIGAYLLLKMRGVRRALVMMSAVLIVVLCFSKILSFGVTSVIALPTQTVALAVRRDESDGLVFRGDGDELKTAVASMRSHGIRRLDWVLWLNEPRVQSIELSSLTLPVERLILLSDRSAYAALPDAQTVVTLQENGSITFSSEGTLEQRGDCYRLCIDQTSILLCSGDTDIETLPPDWRQASVVLIDGKVPDNVSLLQTEQTVVFCSFLKIKEFTSYIPRATGELYFAVADDIPVFLTRGHQDISLRAW